MRGEYLRVPADDEDTTDSIRMGANNIANNSWYPSWPPTIVISLLALLLISSNLMWAVTWKTHLMQESTYWPSGKDALGQATVPIVYKTVQSNFEDDDLSISDAAWAGLFPRGNGVVALPDSLVAAHNIPTSIRSPDEGNQSLYIMAGYHSLHCLTHVRHIIFRYFMSQKSHSNFTIGENTWLHTKHCLGDARQTILCHLDETLFAQANDFADPGEGQIRQCKDLSKVHEWLSLYYHKSNHSSILERFSSHD